MIKADYMDSMGSDLSVVNAARVSFAKQSDWEWRECDEYIDEDGEDATLWPFLSEKDTRLIKFLARENHELPFAHTAISLRMSAPVPNRTQCFKSKVGFVENEESRRYISDEPELFIPEFRSAVQDKKQGSGGIHPDNERIKDEYLHVCKSAIGQYEDMISWGVCPEQARYVLPQGVMVNWIWTGSLLAYARFYNLRSKSDTQMETQEIARQVGDIMADLFPVSWPALTAR